MKNTEFYFHLIQTIRNKAISWVTSLLALMLFFTAPFQKNQPLRASLYLMSLIAANLCLLIDESSRENEQALKDFKTGAILKRQREAALGVTEEYAEPPIVLSASLVNRPQSQEYSPTSVSARQQGFSLESLGTDRDKFPNVFVLGEPGSGKTTLAQYLGVVLDGDCRVAVHPHAKPGDFPGFQLILGGGRNIGKPEDYFVSWADIASKKVVPTIAQVIMALHQLMIDRYASFYEGQDKFPTIDVYFDELPAIASTLGQKFLKNYLPSLIMECRKVGIRIWFLTQSQEVENLGLSGNSSLREGATFIRLGNLALKHAQTLVNSKQMKQAVYSRLKSTPRPCMIDDEIANLPTYEEMTARLELAAKPTYTGRETTGEPKKTTRKRKTKAVDDLAS